MRVLWRWLKRGVLVFCLLLVLLLLPVGYIEVACRGTETGTPYTSIIADPEWQRAESRTLTTYPEWHIVHAYDDYSVVISRGDPHDFQFLRAVTGFWTSLCPLARASSAMGGFTQDSKITIYTIGVSFTAELLAKALYEETLGRVATLIRGEARAPLDKISASQARDYAAFLQQTPWYKWDFDADREALQTHNTDQFRDIERQIALGLEYRAKAAYAGVIAQAVAGVGADELRIRSIVRGLTPDAYDVIGGVTVVAELPEGTLIETDRYRVFTNILRELAEEGGEFVEIAGNDEILFTLTSTEPTAEGAIHSFQRQGYQDYRHLVLVPVHNLAANLRSLDEWLEHVHDY